MEVEHKASPDPADRSLDHANLTPHLSLLTHELTFRENAAICALVRERIRSIVTLPYKLEASLKGELLVLNISSDTPISEQTLNSIARFVAVRTGYDTEAFASMFSEASALGDATHAAADYEYQRSAFSKTCSLPIQFEQASGQGKERFDFSVTQRLSSNLKASIWLVASSHRPADHSLLQRVEEAAKRYPLTDTSVDQKDERISLTIQDDFRVAEQDWFFSLCDELRALQTNFPTSQIRLAICSSPTSCYEVIAKRIASKARWGLNEHEGSGDVVLTSEDPQVIQNAERIEADFLVATGKTLHVIESSATLKSLCEENERHLSSSYLAGMISHSTALTELLRLTEPLNTLLLARRVFIDGNRLIAETPVIDWPKGYLDRVEASLRAEVPIILRFTREGSQSEKHKLSKTLTAIENLYPELGYFERYIEDDTVYWVTELDSGTSQSPCIDEFSKAVDSVTAVFRYEIDLTHIVTHASLYELVLDNLKYSPLFDLHYERGDSEGILIIPPESHIPSEQLETVIAKIYDTTGIELSLKIDQEDLWSRTIGVAGGWCTVPAKRDGVDFEQAKRCIKRVREILKAYFPGTNVVFDGPRLVAEVEVNSIPERLLEKLSLKLCEQPLAVELRPIGADVDDGVPLKVIEGILANSLDARFGLASATKTKAGNLKVVLQSFEGGLEEEELEFWPEEVSAALGVEIERPVTIREPGPRLPKLVERFSDRFRIMVARSADSSGVVRSVRALDAGQRLANYAVNGDVRWWARGSDWRRAETSRITGETFLQNFRDRWNIVLQIDKRGPRSFVLRIGTPAAGASIEPLSLRDQVIRERAATSQHLFNSKELDDLGLGESVDEQAGYIATLAIREGQVLYSDLRPGIITPPAVHTLGQDQVLRSAFDPVLLDRLSWYEELAADLEESYMNSHALEPQEPKDSFVDFFQMLMDVTVSEKAEEYQIPLLSGDSHQIAGTSLNRPSITNSFYNYSALVNTQQLEAHFHMPPPRSIYELAQVSRQLRDNERETIGQKWAAVAEARDVFRTLRKGTVVATVRKFQPWGIEVTVDQHDIKGILEGSAVSMSGPGNQHNVTLEEEGSSWIELGDQLIVRLAGYDIATGIIGQAYFSAIRRRP